MTSTARSANLIRVAAVVAAASFMVPPAAADDSATNDRAADSRSLPGRTAGSSPALGSAPSITVERDKWTLGPKRYKGLRLGMPKKKALKTGLLVNPQKIGKCTWYYLDASEGAMNVGNGVVISPKRGVVSIPGTEKMHTPQGIRMGSVGSPTGSFAKKIRRVYKRYAVDKRIFPMYAAPAPGNKAAHYGFAMGDDHRVKDMSLALNKDGCGLSSWPY